MDYIKLFLADILFGYILQSIGYVLSIFAFNKRRINFKMSTILVLLFSVVMFLIRQIDVINFGIHTILIMIAFILISLGILKTQIYSTVLAVLVTAITIMVSEVINFGILTLIFGAEKIDAMLKSDGTMQGAINKAVAGIPTNLILVTVMLILYIIFSKKIRGGKNNGKTGKEII